MNASRLYQEAEARRKKYLIGAFVGVGLVMLCGAVLLFAGFLQNEQAVVKTNKQVEAQAARKTEPVITAEKVILELVCELELPKVDLVQGIRKDIFEKHPEWSEEFLTPNEYSRPCEELPEVKNIFVHYTANRGTSAAQNRSYFERQKDEHLASVSAHFIIGYNGEIIQCIPLDEIAYAVQTRNYDSISIECCYKAKDGSFTEETYGSLISLLAWLTDVYELETEDILRHYDCGRKKCPLYYTNHPDKWKLLKEDVKVAREENEEAM